MGEHTITFTESYEDDLEQFQKMAKMYPGESQFFAQNSSQSSGEDHITSDMEALYYDTPRSKSGSSSDGSSSVKSSNSRRYKKSKSKGSRDLESVMSQVTSQKVFIENELISSHKQMESITEKISENQIKKEVKDKTIMSGIEKIANNQSALADQYKHIENIIATNATVAKEKDLEDKKIISGIEKIANNQSALADQYKHMENIIATNATVAKEKEEKDKKYVDALEGRLSKMENILQTFQEGQKPIEICTTPK